MLSHCSVDWLGHFSAGFIRAPSAAAFGWEGQLAWKDITHSYGSWCQLPSCTLYENLLDTLSVCCCIYSKLYIQTSHVTQQSHRAAFPEGEGRSNRVSCGLGSGTHSIFTTLHCSKWVWFKGMEKQAPHPDGRNSRVTSQRRGCTRLGGMCRH